MALSERSTDGKGLRVQIPVESPTTHALHDPRAGGPGRGSLAGTGTVLSVLVL